MATQKKGRKNSAPGRAARRHAKRPERRKAPEVVYTPAKPLSRNRLLLHLAAVVATVLALTFSSSIFFRVKHVTVSGCEKYSAWTVREASGIREGDSLLLLSHPGATGKIIAALPYIRTARIGIKLPDTVNIVVEEQPAVYSIRDTAGGWWLMAADGRVLERTDSATAGQFAEVMGVQLVSPTEGQTATAAQPEATGESQPQSGQAGLAAALQVLQLLEQNEAFKGIVSVDASDVSELELWYGTQYQIKLGGTNDLETKIQTMKQTLAQMAAYQSGVLDVSFRVWPDRVVYTPFE